MICLSCLTYFQLNEPQIQVIIGQTDKLRWIFLQTLTYLNLTLATRSKTAGTEASKVWKS